jgi:lauroyl/myristoyl acyltransferase
MLERGGGPQRTRAEGPLLTLDDVFWFLYLYPLRIFAAFGSQRLIHCVGRLFVFRARERRDLAARRILAAQTAGISREEAPRIARQWLENSKSRMIDDLILSWPFRRRKLRCAGMKGFEHLTQALASGKGVILLTAHFCATRMAKRYLTNLGYPMLTVRDQIAGGDWWGRAGRRILEPRRQKFLHSLIGESTYVGDPGCTLKIFQRLRSSGIVHIHFDGRSGKKSVSWPFLGVPRSFSTGIFEIVRLSGCTVVPMLCLGSSSALHISFASPLHIVEASGREEFVRANLPKFVGSIEEQIKTHPEEWEEWMSF